MMWFLGIILFLLCVMLWVCGANDAKYPFGKGKSRGAWLIQHTPIYALAFWLYTEPD